MVSQLGILISPESLENYVFICCCWAHWFLTELKSYTSDEFEKNWPLWHASTTFFMCLYALMVSYIWDFHMFFFSFKKADASFVNQTKCHKNMYDYSSDFIGLKENIKKDMFPANLMWLLWSPCNTSTRIWLTENIRMISIYTLNNILLWEINEQWNLMDFMSEHCIKCLMMKVRCYFIRIAFEKMKFNLYA